MFPKAMVKGMWEQSEQRQFKFRLLRYFPERSWPITTALYYFCNIALQLKIKICPMKAESSYLENVSLLFNTAHIYSYFKMNVYGYLWLQVHSQNFQYTPDTACARLTMFSILCAKSTFSRYLTHNAVVYCRVLPGTRERRASPAPHLLICQLFAQWVEHWISHVLTLFIPTPHVHSPPIRWSEHTLIIHTSCSYLN